MAGTVLFCSLVVRGAHLARPSIDSSNCRRQFSPSRAVPSLNLTKLKARRLVGPLIWWSWRVLPPRPSVYLVSLSYRFRLPTIVVYRRLNSQNDDIPRPRLYKHYGQKCLCIRMNINELPLSEIVIAAATNKLGS